MLTKPPTKRTKSFVQQAGESVYNFILGGFAGAFGAFVVYPIDLGECDSPFIGVPVLIFL